MSRARKLKIDTEIPKPDNTLVVERSEDETPTQAMARKMMEPGLRHAVAASSFANHVLSADMRSSAPGTMDYLKHQGTAADAAEQGDLAVASRMLVSQALTLDAMFTELARRAAVNMGEYIDAADRYAKLALKAQSNSRATIEALAKLHMPREQTVRHVHVHEGGQAVVAEQFHHHSGGGENSSIIEQCHATGQSGSSASLSGADALRRDMPIPGSEGPETLPDAWRDQPRRACG